MDNETKNILEKWVKNLTIEQIKMAKEIGERFLSSKRTITDINILMDELFELGLDDVETMVVKLVKQSNH